MVQSVSQVSGRRKLRSLQERLKQTELAMSKILEQLGTISVEATQGAVPQNSLDSTVDKKSKTNEENKKSVADKEHYLLDLEKVVFMSCQSQKFVPFKSAFHLT